MTSENSDLHDPLDRATAALRDVAVPDGPSPLLARRTLAALYEAEKRTTPVQWRLASDPRWRLAAAAVIALGCTTIVVLTIAGRHRGVAAGPAPDTRRGHEPAPPLFARQDHPRAFPRMPVHPPERASHDSRRQTEQDTGEPPPDSPSTTTVLALASDVAVAGHVYFHGSPPVRRPIDTRMCPDCARAIDGPIYDDSWAVNDDGTLANVVVSISAGLPAGERFPVPADPVVLDQKGCMFQPHVIAAMIGQPIVLRNSDPILHNIRSTDAEEMPAFDLAQPAVGERRVPPLRVVETLKIKCNLHPWMTVWIRTFDHPFFDVTHADGTFVIKGLPPGTYRVKAWHERLGVQEKTITFAGGEPVVMDFTFDSRR